MATVRVEIHAVLEVDIDKWAAEHDNHGHTPSTHPGDVAGQVRWGLFTVEDQIPRWARDAITFISES